MSSPEPGRSARRVARLAVAALACALAACGESPRLVVSWDPTRLEDELPTVVEALAARAPQRALAEWERLQAAGSLPEGAENFRALALGDLGREDEALQAWERELEQHPGNGRAHALIARLLLDRGRLDAVARHVEEARRHAPGFPLVALVEGRLALQRDDDERASRAFRDFLTQDPYGVLASEAYHALAQIAARRGPDGKPEAERLERVSGDLEQAHAYLARYEERLATDPDDVEAAYGVGAAYLNLYVNLFGDRALLDQAEPAFAHVLQREPRHAKALYNVAFIRLEQRRDDEAEALLRAAIEADPDFAPARINLGTLLGKHGDPQGAVRELERALAVASTPEDQGRAHLQLGHARSQLGSPADLRAAILHYREVQALSGGDALGLEAAIADLEHRLASSVSGAATDAGSDQAPGDDPP